MSDIMDEFVSKRIRLDQSNNLEIGSHWLTLAHQHLKYYKEAERIDYEERIIQSRADITFDPLRSKRKCDGDHRLRCIMQHLDGFGIDRTREQRIFHKWFLRATVPHIYGMEWNSDSVEICERLGIREIQFEVLISTPRRFGKTVSVAMFIAAFALEVPGKSIAVFSKTERQTTAIPEKVKDYWTYIRGAMDRIILDNKEQVFIATAAAQRRRVEKGHKLKIPEAEVCKIYSFPGSVDSKYIYLLL